MTEQNATYLKWGLAIAAVTTLVIVASKPAQGGSDTDPTQSPPNAPSFNANKVAMDLLDAMKEMGTDEESVLAILKYVSPAQFNLVFSAFGKRQYNSTTGNQYNYIPFTQLPYVDLKGWLKSELSTSEYNVLKTKYPNKL